MKTTRLLIARVLALCLTVLFVAAGSAPAQNVRYITLGYAEMKAQEDAYLATKNRGGPVHWPRAHSNDGDKVHIWTFMTKVGADGKTHFDVERIQGNPPKYRVRVQYARTIHGANPTPSRRPDMWSGGGTGKNLGGATPSAPPGYTHDGDWYPNQLAERLKYHQSVGRDLNKDLIQHEVWHRGQGGVGQPYKQIRIWVKQK